MSWMAARAVARLYAILFVGVMLAVLTIFVVGDFADRLGAYLSRPVVDVAELYWNKALVAVQQLAPAAMLLAAGATVSILRKRGEWLAMQALGMSRWVVVFPIACNTLFFAMCLVPYDDQVAAQSGVRVDQMMVERFNVWGDYRFYYFPKQWFRLGNHIVHVRGALEGKHLLDVSVFEVNASFHLVRRLDGAQMDSIGGDRWSLLDVVDRRFLESEQTSVVAHPRLEIVMPGSNPQAFDIRTGRPEFMTWQALKSQLELRGRVGLQTERYLLALHNRLAYPMTGVAATLLAVILALRPGRKGHLTLALVEGLGVIVVLFSAMMVGKSLVLGEHLPPFAAAWGPVVALLAVSAALWWRDDHPRPMRPA